MARPVGANAQETRSRLVAIAAERFAEDGVDATPLRAVAREAGVSLATIHHYFGGKKALVEATNDAMMGSLSESLKPLGELLTNLGENLTTANPDVLAETVAKLVRDSYRLTRQNRQAIRMLMRQAASDGELDSRWRDDSLVPFLKQASSVLAKVTGREQFLLRLDLLSLNSLGSRFALSSETELAILAGLAEPGDEVDAELAERAVRTFEDHLADLAVRVLLGDRS